MLPMVAMDGACLRRVMLSFMRPSPVTFTVKGLPGGEKGRVGRLRSLVAGLLACPSSSPAPYQVHACQQT